MTDLYEELPSDQIQEDLYEDLPGSAFTNGGSSHLQGLQQQQQQQQQRGVEVPPPIPTSSIPQCRPGGPISSPLVSNPPATFPPVPSRSSNTQLTVGKTSPQGKKKTKELKKKPAPPKSPNKGGGVNMAEILQKAKARRPIEDLEKSFKDEDPNEKHLAPWANQLRKTSGGRQGTPERMDKEEVPEFVRKARTLSVNEDTSEGPEKEPEGALTLPRKLPPSTLSRKLAPGPPPSAKSVQNIPPVPPKSVDGAVEQERPAWQKQQGKPIAPPQPGGGVRVTPKPIRQAPTKPPISEGKPRLPSKPVASVPAGKLGVASKHTPPLPGKPTPAPSPPMAVVGRVSNGEVNGHSPVLPAHMMRAPKPMPGPRQAAKKNVFAAEESNDHTSTLPRPSSFCSREVAETSDRNAGMMSSVSTTVESSPPPIAPVSRPHNSRGPPPQKPFRRYSNLFQDSQPAVPTRRSSIPHPPKEEEPPVIPERVSSRSPGPPESKTPPMESKPPPPPPDKCRPPSTFSSSSATSFQLPPIPGKPPMTTFHPQPPVSLGQSTPPMGSVMKFRRLPLLHVDLDNPPALPSRNTKGNGKHIRL